MPLVPASPTGRHRRSRRGRKAFPFAFALALVVITGFAGRSIDGERTPTWRLVWHDEFDGPAGPAPNPAVWHYATGRGLPGGPAGWGNDEIQTYTADPANIGLDGQGQLRLTATRGPDGQWRSGRVETWRSDFAPPPGGSMKVEARITLPGGGQGYWPAFWMLGQSYRARPDTWPAPGEIDVMENVDSNEEIHGSLHCDTRPDQPCHSRTGLGNSYTLSAPAGLAGPHVYSVIWDTRPKRMRWQVDGQTYAQLTPNDIGSKTWDETFDHGYFLLLNLAIGGDWPGPPNLLTIPGASMSVDYVRVWTAQ
jgi:beta-glucanase (GH16 family)